MPENIKILKHKFKNYNLVVSIFEISQFMELQLVMKGFLSNNAIARNFPIENNTTSTTHIY